MSYESPDRKWVEIEMKLMDSMGKKWFLNNPPKIWKLPKKPPSLVLESFKKKLRGEGFEFKFYVPFVHRFMRDLISEKQKIVIHHRDVSVNEKKIQKILGYRFFKFKQSEWRNELERIVEEIKSHESKSVVR
jgi:hypothetical protein